MPLVFGCVAPHGNVIPCLPGSEEVAATTAAMRELGSRLAATRPDTVVIVEPHGVRVDGAMAVSLSERAAGTLEDPATVDGVAHPVTVEMAVDQAFARDLMERARQADVPVAGIHYGATSGPHDRYPLDWGAIVPLEFMGAHFEPQPRIVVVVPSRVLPLDALVRFGKAVASAAAASTSRVALIASADQAHAHTADGPYGFDPAAAEFDQMSIDAVKDGDLKRLLHADPEMVRRACPDALWQMLVLAGAQEHTPLTGEFLSYERPSYFGMLVAAYAPAMA